MFHHTMHTALLPYVQAELEASRARLTALGKDERLSERVWRTVKPPGDDMMSLHDLMRAWKGACHGGNCLEPLRLPHASCAEPRNASFCCLQHGLCCLTRALAR